MTKQILKIGDKINALLPDSLEREGVIIGISDNGYYIHFQTEKGEVFMTVKPMVKPIH